jgi:phage I-like protein
MQILATAGELENAPSEFRVFPYGQIELEGNPIVRATIDEESMATIINDFARRGNDMLIDYEHQSLKDNQAPAAGWINRLINKGKGGLWAAVTWTRKAKAYLENREYRYYSPVFHIRKSDQKVIGLENIALTNSPRTNRITPIVAKKEESTIVISSDQRRLNKMMGVSDEDFLETVKAMPGGVQDNLTVDAKFFETTEEKLTRILG